MGNIMELVTLVALVVWIGVGICAIRMLVVYNEFVEPMRKMIKYTTKMYEKMYNEIEE